METFSFFMIVFALFMLSICTFSYVKNRKTIQTTGKIVTITAYAIGIVFISIYSIRAVLQHSMYKHALVTEATLIGKDIDVAKGNKCFLYEYYVDSVRYEGEGYARRVASDLDVGDTFYIFYDSSRPWMDSYLEKDDKLLTDLSWANRQLILKRKKTMLWWNE